MRIVSAQWPYREHRRIVSLQTSSCHCSTTTTQDQLIPLFATTPTRCYCVEEWRPGNRWFESLTLGITILQRQFIPSVFGSNDESGSSSSDMADDSGQLSSGELSSVWSWYELYECCSRSGTLLFDSSKSESVSSTLSDSVSRRWLVLWEEKIVCWKSHVVSYSCRYAECESICSGQSLP
jgi:hypothetical protein